MKARDQLDYFLQNTLSQVISQGNGVDQKANILLAANFVVLSVWGGKIKTDPHDAALYIGIVFFLSSALFALLAVMPRTEASFQPSRSGNPDQESERNLLGFQAISKMRLPEFQKEMLATMRNEQAVYLAALKNIHQMSCLVSRKFRLARISYQLLFTGIVLYILCILIQHRGAALLFP